jgi:hypothetical protein
LNKDDERFQKRLALYSILAAAFFTVVAVLITLGFTWSQFNLVPTTDNVQINNSTAKAIQTFSSSIRDAGNKLVWDGIGVLIAGITIFSLAIIKDTSKRKLKISKNPRILFDEMYDGKDIELGKIIITEDPEIIGGCQENNLPCIKLGQNPSIDEIIKAIESL